MLTIPSPVDAASAAGLRCAHFPGRTAAKLADSGFATTRMIQGQVKSTAFSRSSRVWTTRNDLVTKYLVSLIASDLIVT